MELKVYSMKDRLNGFMNIFFEHDDEIAKRGFLHALKTADKNSLFFTNPEDYSLYCLGTMDIRNGILKVLPIPDFIVSGNSLITNAIEDIMSEDEANANA